MRHFFTKNFGAAFSVTVVPTLKDNFSYLIHDKATNTLAAVDVNSDYTPFFTYMKEQQLSTSSFATILSTHKHWDHAGGNVELAATLAKSSGSAVQVYGGAKDGIPAVTHPVKEGDVFSVGQLRVDVFDVPCHTRGHVLYKVHHPQHPSDGAALFTGDTMFIAGLGCFFEGDAKDMCVAMKKIFDLNAGNDYAMDKDTFIFPGHEYTAGFMKFSEKMLEGKGRKVEADAVRKNAAVYAAAVSKGNPSVPSSIADEKVQNLFLRVADPAFCAAMGKGDEVQLMDFLYNACD